MRYIFFKKSYLSLVWWVIEVNLNEKHRPCCISTKIFNLIWFFFLLNIFYYWLLLRCLFFQYHVSRWAHNILKQTSEGKKNKNMLPHTWKYRAPDLMDNKAGTNITWKSKIQFASPDFTLCFLFLILYWNWDLYVL